MPPNLVCYESRPPAAILTLNRPGQRNALCRPLLEELVGAFHWALDEREVRCIILTGAGPAFSAGLDLAELAELLDQPGGPPEQWPNTTPLAAVFNLIYQSPKPTLAAVNGTAVAGGAGLVSVCDLALAVPEALFGYPGVRRGLVAALVMPHLLRHVNERQARYLLLTGELIPASQALDWGLINAVEPCGTLLCRAMELSHSLAQGGPRALAETRLLLNSFSHQAPGIIRTSQESASPRVTEEVRQGLEAFFTKKPPPWSPSSPENTVAS